MILTVFVLSTFFPGFPDGFYRLYRKFVDHGPLCRHEVKSRGCKRKEGRYIEDHGVSVDEEIDGQPDLESYREQTCYDAYAGLEEECLEAGGGSDMGYEQHYQQCQVRQFL